MFEDEWSGVLGDLEGSLKPCTDVGMCCAYRCRQAPENQTWKVH